MISHIFLDLDGTVYLSGKIIDSVDVELRRLAAGKTHIYYMTNNTSYSSEEYAEKLAKLDLPLARGAIISPTVVLSDWLRDQGIERVFAVGTKAFCNELVMRSGVTLDAEKPSCVIIAFDRELTYAKLETACGLINRGIAWYVTHIDLACPSAKGPIPDCGAIAQLIETTTGISPAGHFGKPSQRMLSYLRKLIKSGELALVAGDRLYTDAEVGLQLGVRTVVVCSGEFQPGTAEVDSRIEVYSTLADFLRTHTA